MNSDEVEQYLHDNPERFAQLFAQLLERNPELLESITVPHPYGGRAIPLSERQTLGLREKVKLLEGKLSELIQFGEENDAIGDRMHRLCLALLPAADLRAMLQALYYNLREDFAVPHAALRLWRPDSGAPAGESPEFAPVSDELRRHAGSLEHPVCGADASPEVLSWFGDAAAHLRSVACTPLRDANKVCTGMLVLASEDAKRFYPEMGTLYLQRLGELLGAALQRYL